MRIGTTNRLAHYQCEYRELCEQTAMLNNQVTPLELEISTKQQYCSVNSGDRRATAELRKTLQRYRSLLNTIRRNNQRLACLERQIAIENNRICMQQQKMTMRGYR